MSHIKTAQEWHSGQWSALYKFQCNGKVLDYQHRADLISELESILAGFESATSYSLSEYIRVQSFLVFVYETECDDSPQATAATIMREILQHDENQEQCYCCGNMICSTDCTMHKIQQWIDEHD